MKRRIIGVSVLVGALMGLASASALGQSINAGEYAYSTDRPFETSVVAEFDTPWAIAFLPDGRMVVTEKGGQMFVVSADGQKIAIAGVPAVAASGQNGLLHVAVSPDFANDRRIYFTFMEPGDGGSGLALARSVLGVAGSSARLQDLEVIWRQLPKGGGGQPGGIIAFAPDGRHLFLTSGDRMRPDTAQDPDQALGKVLRLNLDGSTPADNPNAAAGAVRAQTWTSGHRNPYGLAFDGNGQLWLHEMGPRGGDELNLIVAGENYGWPIVSNGDNYNGTPIPRHSTRPEFTPPVLYWTPVIAPAGLAFYQGDLFPDWRGSALIGGLASTAIVRVSFDRQGGADEADRWDMGSRIRDVAVAPDGSVWAIEDANPGALMRLTPTATD
ncbi:PQQ-dependent sugar dehydrogenase [Pseudochelatococcus sp. B33]